MPEQLKPILQNLLAFGPRRLAIMGGVLVLVLTVIGVGSVYLNRPAYETLYVGLERSDVNQIGLVLGEAGIGFDVASDGTTVLVPAGKTAQARMMLAEKGLPTSANAGYELFDNVGSLGLTSFMQQITRVRALEGEIARTIQSISGIRAARVHIVMSERANFRRDEQKPSASVVIRSTGMDAARSAISIRYLVAAAVPGLSPEDVTVLDSSGTLLAAGDDPNNNSASQSLGVERTIETQIEDNIRRALAPYLGPDNFRASVKADVNTDTRQTEETIFDPESRVERSIQVVKSNENKQSDILKFANHRRTEPPRVRSDSDRRAAVVRAERAQGRDHKLRDQLKEDRNGQQRLHGHQDVDCGGRQPAAADSHSWRCRHARADCRAHRGHTEAGLIGDRFQRGAWRRHQRLVGRIHRRSRWRSRLQGPGMLASIGQYAGTMINAASFIVVAFLLAFFGLKPMVAAIGQATPAIAASGADDSAAHTAKPAGGQFSRHAGIRGRGIAGRARRFHAARRAAPEDPPGAAGSPGAHGRPE